jgi:hypothetical protein
LRPESPRAPTTIAAASTASAVSMTPRHASPAAAVRGSASSPASRAIRAPCSAVSPACRSSVGSRSLKYAGAVGAKSPVTAPPYATV